MNENMRRILRLAKHQGSFTIFADSPTDANNRRQRFYRLREQIREQEPDEDFVELMRFEIDGKNLVITYDKALEVPNVLRTAS